MIEFNAQLDYLRQIQTTFVHGSGRMDIVDVFSTILLFVGPVLGAVMLWYHRRLVVFHAVRLLSRFMRKSSSNAVIEEYLADKGVLIEVYLLGKHGPGKKICMARLDSIYDGSMKLSIAQADPTSMDFKGRKVICFCKTIAFSGRKINSFTTYVAHSRSVQGRLKTFIVLAPVRYSFTIRRKHQRKRFGQEDMIRVKLWDGRKRKTFWMARPDLQTLKEPGKAGSRPHLSVGNISGGGIRLIVNNPKDMPGFMREGSSLVLRISIKDPKTKKFFYFTAVGTIRSKFKVKGGLIGLGVQFQAVGEKVPGGSGSYSWKPVNEIKALAQFLEKN